VTEGGFTLTEAIVGTIVIVDELLTSLPFKVAVTVSLIMPLTGPAVKVTEGKVTEFSDPRLLFIAQE
jgi:hypothetical protein